MMADDTKTEWQSERVALRDLTPWEHNPKTISKTHARRLLAYWDKVGQFQTIAAGPNGEIYDGTQRYSVLLAAYGKDYQVDIRRASRALTEAERQELIIAAHVGTVGQLSWDELSGWNANDLIEWGLDAETLRTWKSDAGALGNLLESAKPAAEAPEPDIDHAEELRQKWGVELGQLWIIPSKSGAGEHRIVCGDCTDRVVVERVMGGEKAKLGVTSPPYAVGKEYEIDISFQEHLELLAGVADRALEIIEPGGFFFVNFGEIAALSHASPLTGSKRQCIYPISKDYWRIFHEERGMDLYAQRIWYKPFNRLQQPFWSYHTSIPHHQEWEHIWT